MERMDGGQPMTGVDVSRYQVEQPQGLPAQDHASWRKAATSAQMQLEYNRLRLTNLEMLERWGGKAWIAHTAVVRATERELLQEVTGLRAEREEVNKKRKLDQISCGNELRRLAYELDRYRFDNSEVEGAMGQIEAEVGRLRQMAADRGIDIAEVDPEYAAAVRAEAAAQT
mmetsp:Transcript_37063/g.85982  ORF Transcript_37063/g.85982 Transcript_37063/m.85982 type:complete len:171 (+) Transcript_37063:2-514(+)